MAGITPKSKCNYAWGHRYWTICNRIKIDKVKFTEQVIVSMAVRYRSNNTHILASDQIK